MPNISKFFIRISLIYLVLGAFIGVLISFGKVCDIYMCRFFLTLIPFHVIFMVFGWFFNFIFSVIFWIFPRLQEGVSRGNGLLQVISATVLQQVSIPAFYPLLLTSKVLPLTSEAQGIPFFFQYHFLHLLY